MKHILRYITVSETASVGVDIAATTGFTSTRSMPVSTTDKPMNMVTVFPTVRDAS